MFFSQFWTWLNGVLANYVGTNTAAIAGAIEPAVVTLATIYVMFWGFMSMTGRIQEPIWEAVKRMLTIGIIIGVGLNLWTYNTLVVDTFINAPSQLAAVVTGAASPVTIIDTIWDQGGQVADVLWNKAGFVNGNFGFYVAGLMVWVIMGAVAVYAFFLLALSKIALALILALGPVFICLLLFESTRRFFEAWIAQLSNYALIAVLTSLVGALMLKVVAAYATRTAALGSALVTVDVLNMVLAAAIVILLMRLVMPIASGLASGIALNSFGMVSGLVSRGLRTGGRTGYEMTRGVMDGLRGEPRSRWDTLRRGAGNRIGAGIAGAYNSVRGNQQGGTLRPREEVMPRPHYR